MHANREPSRRRSLVAVVALMSVSLGALLAGTPHAAAVTYVRGWISSNTTWGIADNTYVLTGHVTVRSGVTLTILPGTTVRFDPARALYVEGSLLADANPGSPIAFLPNSTISPIPPIGIQFNFSATGSVSWSTFDRMERSVTAIESSPSVTHNTVKQATYGFALYRSATLLADNTILRATTGVFVAESNAQILRNTINGTTVGIEALASGDPYIANNVMTNTTAGFALGIHVAGGAAADLWYNTVQGTQGSRGLNGASPGDAGGAGGTAVGILVDAAPFANVVGNAIESVTGGRGGDGVDNPGATGGAGGNGGAAAGLYIFGTPSMYVAGNTIMGIFGGRGGLGGGSPATNVGGNGGSAGDAAAIQGFGATAAAWWYSNFIAAIRGGVGGTGGFGTAMDGNGGAGGDGLGLFTWSAQNGDANGNIVQDVRGGPGGNSSAGPLPRGPGGPGGAVVGIEVTGAAGASLLTANAVSSLTGGTGGRGAAGGRGGDATGMVALGKADGRFNATSATSNSVQVITGGTGAPGGRTGGGGGASTGLVLSLVTGSTGSNTVGTLQGGSGGDASDGSDGGRGGDAAGVAASVVKDSRSARDSLDTVTGGSAGFGPPVRASFGIGYYMVGNASFTTRMTIDNASLANVGTTDLFVDVYTAATTINTTFDPAKLIVQSVGNLTVQNFLAVRAFWPNGVSLVAGAHVLVKDKGVTVWDVTAASGEALWLLVTDRVYIDSNTPKDNETLVTVSYLAYGFAANPRSVDMATSHTEAFVMIDSDAPTSAAGALPKYTAAMTFSVTYTASDGNGGGLANITLWYRKNNGGWTPFATHPAAANGQFSFTATGDGTYEFATTASDVAGNNELLPAGNDTWTIVDTTRPGSSVQPLPTYETSASFLVAWAPDPGVTDIASYTIQFNRGFGWVNWLVDTKLTSAMFTASPAAGLYQFRSIAKDFAGNVELVPPGNDTWTIVDTEAPASSVLPLGTWQTSLAFLVRWASEAKDVASYRVQVRDSGGAWTDWIPSTTTTSATYTGVDGHAYEFRSIATDAAGNVEPAPAGNDTWTIVDVKPPESAVDTLPLYWTSLTIALGWGPLPGTSDITRYTVQVSDNAGPWTNLTGYVDTPARSATLGVLDGHRYAFRSIAKDAAGNVEAASPGNDTWTTVDVSVPSTTVSLAGTSGSAGWYRSPVDVTLTAADATSGVASTAYRLDGGAWQPYTIPFTVGSDGTHALEYSATDRAGLVEAAKTASFKLDVTAPVTGASVQGTMGDNGWWRSAVSVSLGAADAASGVSLVTYRLDAGAWQTYAAPFSVTADGVHALDYYATDAAGLVEAAKTVSFSLDATRPTVVSTSPRGSGTNTTPLVVVAFSEPMNRAAVESAFSITPDMNGAFSWSADSRQVTFTPDRPLQTGKDYFVSIDSSAKDLAGNTMAQASNFQFATAGSPPGGGALQVGSFWWIFVVVAAILGTLFVLRNRLPFHATTARKEKERPATIDDVFLLYHDGILIKHETRRLKPDIDTDILSGMLTAVQHFVKDSFRTEEGELDELTFGEMHILIGRGKRLILAAMIQGDGKVSMSAQIEKCIQDMEDHHAEQIEAWDGNMSFAKVLAPYIKKLIHGEYA